MDRREFIKLLGIVPVLPVLNAVKIPEQPPGTDINLGEFPVAGFQFHDGMQSAVISHIKKGDALLIRHQENNPYDCKAIAILTERNEMLGYLPKTENKIPALLAEQGINIYAYVASVNAEAKPWERLTVSLWITM